MLKALINTPDLLLTLVLSIVLFVYALLGQGFVELRLEVYIHTFVFTAGFIMCFRYVRSICKNINFINIKPFVNRNIIYLIALALLGYSLGRIFFVYTAYSFADFMSFRSLISFENNELGGRFSIGVAFSFPAALAGYFAAHDSKDVKIKIFFFIISFLLAALSTTKMFLVLWIIFIYAKSRVNLGKIVFFVVLFLIVFSASHLILYKFSANPEDGISNAILITFQVYLLGPFGAYQNLLDGVAQIDRYMMFYGLKDLLEMYLNLRLNDTNILPWTNIGDYFTNNYTAFGYWYAFFGSSFLIFMPIFLGSYYGFFFGMNNLTKCFDFYKYFLLFCVAFIPISDHFLSAIAMHGIYLCFSLILFATKKQSEKCLP